MNLNNLDLTRYDTPIAPKVSPSADYEVRIKLTKSGQQILLCTCDPAPADVIASAEQQELPLFTGREVKLLAGMPEEQIADIIKAKLVNPGCSVDKVINLEGVQ